MLNLTTLVSRVAARLNKNALDTAVYTRLKNHINDACLEKWQGYAWSFRYREYPLVLSPRVISGTMTATLNSQAITASGTPFIVGTHEGAWIRFTADTVTTWYRILSISSTSAAIMEPAYQGTTGGSKAYELMKSDYLVPSEITDIGTLSVIFNRSPIRVSYSGNTSSFDQPPTASGAPILASVFNDSQAVTTYSTGTVSGTSGSPALTGVGTSWLTNLVPGDEVLINGDTNYYRVYQVNSDTSLTLYNNLMTTPATATYSASRQFGKILRIWPVSDTAYVLFIKGLRQYSPLINTTDTNELLVRHPHAVLEAAVWREAGSSPDPREDSLYMKSEKMWLTAQGEDEAILPANNYEPIYNPRRLS